MLSFSDPGSKERIDILARAGIGISILEARTIEIDLSHSTEAEFGILGTNQYIKFLNHEKKRDWRLSIDRGTISKRAEYLVEPAIASASGIFLARPERAIVPPDDIEQLLSIEGLHETTDWASHLKNAEEILKLGRDTILFLNKYAPWLAAIRNDAPGVQSSTSFDCLPGLIFSSRCETDLYLAETLVHECDHQRHYLLTLHETIWRDEERATECVHRSPWRNDARPIDGILRGASAFATVGEFWCQVLENPRLRQEHKSWVFFRAITTNYQAYDALWTIAQHKDLWTDFGVELCNVMQSTAARSISNLSNRPRF